jgi:hypothetical protein
LDLVDQARKLPVRANFFAHQISDYFLMSHAKCHFSPGTVFKAPHFRIDLIPPSRLLPQISRLDDRHGQLLPANHVYFLSDYGLDPFERLPGKWQITEYASGELGDKTCPQQKLVAGNVSFCWNLTQCLGK